MVAPCILTVGKFEGIHRGHRVLLCQVEHRAKSAGITPVVVTFEPHPFKFLHDPDYKPIFTKPERESLIRILGINEIVTFDFDATFAAMSAEDFCREIFQKFNPREIIVGENYRFGHNREGTIETLRKAGATVCVVRTLSEGTTICTSRIRDFLSQNKFHEAEALLGFPFFVAGEVTQGRQLGRLLGFPTMNLYPPEEKFLPQNGVYETRTRINGIHMTGLTNIGVRPTVSKDAVISVETHIPTLDAKEMYGKQIKVEFKRFLRPERHFESAEELTAQIRKDMEALK